MTLTAFARCNGCEAGIDEGFQEKLDRLVEEGTQVVHLGKCTDRKDTGPCPVIAQAADYLAAKGGPDRTRDSLTGNMRHTKCRRANLRESDSPGGVSYFSGRGEKKMIGLAYSFLW